jgi:hypothetical protein
MEQQAWSSKHLISVLLFVLRICRGVYIERVIEV